MAPPVRLAGGHPVARALGGTTRAEPQARGRLGRQSGGALPELVRELDPARAALVQALERRDAGDVAGIEIERAHDVVLGVGAAAPLQEEERAIQQRARAIRRRGRHGGARRVQAERGVAPREGRELGGIVQRPERSAALGEQLAVQAERLVRLAEPRAPQLGEPPQERGARLTRRGAARRRSAGPRPTRAAARRSAPNPPSGQQEALGRGARRRVLGIEIEDGEPGRRRLGRVRARALRQRGDLAQEAQLLGHARDALDRRRRRGATTRAGRPVLSRRRRGRAREAADRPGRLGERHDPHVERRLELARGVEQRGPLGERAQASSSPTSAAASSASSAAAKLAPAADLAAAAARAVGCCAGGCPRRQAARRAACSEARRRRPRDRSSRARVSARRSPRRRRRAGLELRRRACRGAEQLEPATREILAVDDALEQSIGERERRRRARVPRHGAFERGEHGLDGLPRLEPREQPLRVTVVFGGRRGVGRRQGRRDAPRAPPRGARRPGQVRASDASPAWPASSASAASGACRAASGNPSR